MGCASSKPLKNQAHAEGWTTRSSKSKQRMKTSKSNRAIDDHHRHLVALTSSSYGLLKVDSPKPALEVQKKNTSGIDSLNDMYDKLRKLESTESAPKPWNEVSGLLETLKPGLEKNNSSPAQGWTVRPADRANPENPETIDVRDMMRDLDEETPRGPSPSKLVSPRAIACSQPVSTNGFVSRQCKRIEKTVSFHTVAELDARFGTPNCAAALDKITKGPLQDVVKKSTMQAHCKKADRDGFEKENAKPPGTRNELLREREGDPSRTGTGLRSPFAPPINLKSNTSLHQVPSMVEKGSNVNRRDTVETRFLSNDTIARSGGGISPSTGTNRSARPRKVNLTLNLDYKNSLSTGASLRWITSTPVGSFSKRALLNNTDGPNSPLFDPALLESYEKALENFSENDWNAIFANDELQQNKMYSECIEADKGIATLIETNHTELSEASNLSNNIAPTKIQRKLYDPFETFEEKCPPGGDKTVVLYTTTLRGIRKTFEDCNNVRDILQSFGLSIDERDVSMHLKFRNELRELMGRVMSVPRMFIKGRYIGGVEEVVKLHEDGHLIELVEGLPKEMNGGNCDGCGGVRFVPCLECSGSCKIVNESNKVVRCSDCNENGLIQCPICS